MSSEQPQSEDKRPNFDPRVLENVIDEILEFKQQADEVRDAARTKLAKINENIAQVYKRATKLGLKKKPIKTEIKLREHDEKRQQIVDDLDEEDQDMLIQYQQSLGTFADTPLGKQAMADAAKRDEERRKKRQDAADSLVQDNMTNISGIKQK